MKLEMIRKYHFYAAHRNKEAGEKCGRIHGHTYDVKVYLKFNELKNGITILFSDVDKLIEPIIKSYCHWFLVYEKDELCDALNMLNEPYLKVPFETSAENLAMWIFRQIKNDTKLPIFRIELAETKSSVIIYEE